MSVLISRARRFATYAHGGQKRKYTGDPYIVHPEAVADLVAGVTGDEEVIAAAWLHDTVEDTSTVHSDIYTHFGSRMGHLVWELTDVSVPDDGNRAARKAIDRKHLGAASGNAQTVKLADLLDNTASIVEHDPGFAKVYLEEKRLLLEVLTGGNWVLYERARKSLECGLTAIAKQSASKPC